MIMKQTYGSNSNPLQSVTKDAVTVSGHNLMREGKPFNHSQNTVFNSLRRQKLVSSGEHINLHFILTFLENGKGDSIQKNMFLLLLFNFFLSDAFPKLMEILK